MSFRAQYSFVVDGGVHSKTSFTFEFIPLSSTFNSYESLSMYDVQFNIDLLLIHCFPQKQFNLKTFSPPVAGKTNRCLS